MRGSELMPFVFDGRSVRVMEDGEGNPWFVAKDVALALGYHWNGQDCIAHVPEEWRRVRSVLTLRRGEQETWLLSEQGLYFFLGRSDKAAALPFQKWLAGEVLPALRKTGQYRMAQATEQELPEAHLRLLTSWLIVCFSRSVSLTRALLPPHSEDFLFESFGNHFYDSCAYWLQTPYVVRHGGGLVTADKSGAFFVFNVKFTRWFVMSDSPIYGSDLAAVIQAQLGVVEDPLTIPSLNGRIIFPTTRGVTVAFAVPHTVKRAVFLFLAILAPFSGVGYTLARRRLGVREAPAALVGRGTSSCLLCFSTLNY